MVRGKVVDHRENYIYRFLKVDGIGCENRLK